MKIIWTKNAELTLNEIVDYIENDFGNLIAENYYLKVLETVDNIENIPDLYPIFKKQDNIRKAVINKKTILYYRVVENDILLLAFYDVRMGTHKL